MHDLNSAGQPEDQRHAIGTLLKELEWLREESEATQCELQQRSRELAATAAIAEATSTSQLDLGGTLDRALEVVVDITGLPAAWIALLPQSGGQLVVAGSAKLPENVLRELAASQLPDCKCAEVLASRQPQLVHPLHANCPMRSLDLGNGQPATCHASVPLLTRSDAVGVLNLASDKVFCLDEPLLALLSVIGRQLGIAVENARLWDELKQQDRQRRLFLEAAMADQEEERKVIARELHDQIGQALTSLRLGLSALAAESDDSGRLAVAPSRLKDLQDLVADTMHTVRHLALGLRPSVLDDLGLLPALKRCVRVFRSRHKLEIDLQTVGLEERRLPSQVETALYRITQEALTNVVQHAHVSRASLFLGAGPEMVVLIVEDEGRGFEAERVMRGPADEHWLGLYGMRERAELLGGTLTVESAPGAGTSVFAWISVPNEQEAERE